MKNNNKNNNQNQWTRKTEKFVSKTFALFNQQKVSVKSETFAIEGLLFFFVLRKRVFLLQI